MNKIATVLQQIKELINNQKEILLNQLEDLIFLETKSDGIINEVKNIRFSKGAVCCHCTSHAIVRNGKNHGVQRYRCKACNRTFSDLSLSATYRSKKPLSKWLKYARCMVEGYSIRKCAEIVIRAFTGDIKYLIA